jgi:hypothetical protein
MSGKLLEKDGATDETVIEADFDDISDVQGDVDAQLDSVISEFAGENELSAKVKVYRVEKGEGKMGWVFDCLPAELPILERVRDEYGPGDYVSRLYIGRKLKRVFPFTIAAPVRPGLGQVQKQASGDVGALAEVIKQTMDSFKELIVQNNAPQAQPTVLEMQTQFMTQMAAMKEMFSGGGESKGSAVKDLRDMLLLVEDLRGEKRETEPKTIFDNLGELIDKALPALTHAVESSSSPRPAKPAAIQQTEPGQQGEKEKMSFAMKMQLGLLCKMAAKNADPLTYANLILDQSDEAQLTQLVKFLKSENWLENLTKVNVSVAQYPIWFGELKKELFSELFPELDQGAQDGDTSEEIIDKNPEIECDNVRPTSENENNDNP